MKKKLAFTILMILCLLLVLPSCSTQKCKIALITDVSNIDGNTVSRYAWEGAVAYAEKYNVSCGYYKPSKADRSALEDSVIKAVSGGAEIIILPGKMFETVAYEMQKKYQGVHFILLDGECRSDTGERSIASNTACAVFEEKDAGFAAGYSIVHGVYNRDKMTAAIGFIGESEDCCAGFLQGADKAAGEIGLIVNYEVCFISDRDGNETIKTKAAKMYEDGIDVILAEGDGTLKPVSDAAKEKNGKLAGAYTDKRYYSERVVTSAVKNYAYVTNKLITAFYEDRFAEYSGKTTVYGKENGGTGIPVTVNSDSNGNAFDRLNGFDLADYRAFSEKMASGVYGIANGSGINRTDADISALLGLKNSVYGFPVGQTDE